MWAQKLWTQRRAPKGSNHGGPNMGFNSNNNLSGEINANNGEFNAINRRDDRNNGENGNSKNKNGYGAAAPSN